MLKSAICEKVLLARKEKIHIILEETGNNCYFNPTLYLQYVRLKSAKENMSEK